MPVAPTPQTIQIDLSAEYLDFLEMASRTSSLSPQAVMREALTMLKDAKLSRSALAVIANLGDGNLSNLKKASLAAWDRWTESRGQQLPVSDDLASFVEQLITDGVAKDATGIVMLALLRYAKVMDFLPREGEYES